MYTVLYIFFDKVFTWVNFELASPWRTHMPVASVFSRVLPGRLLWNANGMGWAWAGCLFRCAFSLPRGLDSFWAFLFLVSPSLAGLLHPLNPLGPKVYRLDTPKRPRPKQATSSAGSLELGIRLLGSRELPANQTDSPPSTTIFHVK